MGLWENGPMILKESEVIALGYIQCSQFFLAVGKSIFQRDYNLSPQPVSLDR